MGVMRYIVEGWFFFYSCINYLNQKPISQVLKLVSLIRVFIINSRTPLMFKYSRTCLSNFLPSWRHSQLELVKVIWFDKTRWMPLKHWSDWCSVSIHKVCCTLTSSLMLGRWPFLVEFFTLPLRVLVVP